MRRLLSILIACACVMSCTVTKREGGGTSSRPDASVAPGSASALSPNEFPTTSTPAPTAAEWAQAIPLSLPEWDAPCTASRVRGWLRVACPAKDRPMEGVQLLHSRGFWADVTTEDTPQLAAAVLPVRPGGDIELTFLLPDGARALWVRWSGGRTPTISFKKEFSPHEKLRCTGSRGKGGPCCYRAFSGTSFNPELKCDLTRYQELCTSNAECDTSQTKRVCRPGPPGTNVSICTLP